MISRNTRIHFVLLLLCSLLIVIPLINKTPDKQTTEQAVAAAEQFLGLVDAGQYIQSWQGSSVLLKDKVSQQEWDQQLAKIRSLLGSVIEREQDEITSSPSLGDLPEGEYVVLSYTSKYQAKQKVAEIITVTNEADGHWRVAGYFVQ